MASFALATEDIVSEEVGLRLISELGENFSVDLKFRKNGNSYLKQKLPSFCELSKHYPLLLITDLDQASCPSRLTSDWLSNRPKPPKLLFRVAVREIESWLLADHDGIIKLFGAHIAKLSENPELLADPKRKLLQCAQSASRAIREDMLPRSNAIALTGLGYNRRLTDFVRDVWSPTRAETRSNSLKRTRQRLVALAAEL
jgi:hypothetical protein